MFKIMIAMNNVQFKLSTTAMYQIHTEVSRLAFYLLFSNLQAILTGH
jgi:hypothetical protein